MTPMRCLVSAFDCSLPVQTVWSSPTVERDDEVVLCCDILSCRIALVLTNKTRKLRLRFYRHMKCILPLGVSIWMKTKLSIIIKQLTFRSRNSLISSSILSRSTLFSSNNCLSASSTLAHTHDQRILLTRHVAIDSFMFYHVRNIKIRIVPCQVGSN